MAVAGLVASVATDKRNRGLETSESGTPRKPTVIAGINLGGAWVNPDGTRKSGSEVGQNFLNPLKLGGIFGGSDGGENIEIDIPGFEENPYYTSGIETLNQFSQNALMGNVPGAYQDIYMSGGPEFESALDLTKRDITSGVYEDITRRGVGRGGIGTTAIARAVGDVSRVARFDERNRALGAQERLLGTAIGGQEFTTTAGLQQEQIQNQFNIAQKELELQALALEANLGVQAGTLGGSGAGSAIATGANLLTSYLSSKSGGTGAGGAISNAGTYNSTGFSTATQNYGDYSLSTGDLFQNRFN